MLGSRSMIVVLVLIFSLVALAAASFVVLPYLRAGGETSAKRSLGSL